MQYRNNHLTWSLPSAPWVLLGSLLQCLRSRSWVVDDACMVANNFLRVRTELQWPFEIPLSDIMTPLQTNVHWLLPVSLSVMSLLTHRVGAPWWLTHFVHLLARSIQARDKMGRAILVLRPQELDFKACSLKDYQKMGVYLVEQSIKVKEVQESGMVMLIDLTGASFSKLSHLSIADAQRGAKLWSDAFPCKLKVRERTQTFHTRTASYLRPVITLVHG